MLDGALSLARDALAATSAADASHAFRDAVLPRGATYLQTRRYRRPTAPLTSATHWAAGGFVARHAVPGWVGSAGFDYVCFGCNPLLEPIRRGQTLYRFSDFAPHRDKAFGAYWEAFTDARIGDALCATAYGPDRRIASIHLGFDRREFDPNEALAMQLAALMLAEKLLTFEQPDTPRDHEPALTPRERASLAFVAEGKTDWEIATIFGVAEATARFHVDNARRKLKAVNRAHAVARFLTLNGPL